MEEMTENPKMKVHIQGDYYLTSSPTNFMLCKKIVVAKGKTKGKKRMEVMGYYSNVPAVLQGFLEEKLRVSTAKTLKELLSVHRALCAEIRDLFGIGADNHTATGDSGRLDEKLTEEAVAGFAEYLKTPEKV